MEHDFFILEGEFEGVDDIPYPNEKVSMSDHLITYIWDSLRWIYTLWNGTHKKRGLNYYGLSVINGQDLIKFFSIINQWRRIFELSPDKFYIRGLYCIDEKSYEKVYLKKKKVLAQFQSLILICKRAIDENKSLVHWGI